MESANRAIKNGIPENPGSVPAQRKRPKPAFGRRTLLLTGFLACASCGPAYQFGTERTIPPEAAKKNPEEAFLALEKQLLGKGGEGIATNRFSSSDAARIAYAAIDTDPAKGIQFIQKLLMSENEHVQSFGLDALAHFVDCCSSKMDWWGQKELLNRLGELLPTQTGPLVLHIIYDADALSHNIALYPKIGEGMAEVLRAHNKEYYEALKKIEEFAKGPVPEEGLDLNSQQVLVEGVGDFLQYCHTEVPKIKELFQMPAGWWASKEVEAEMATLMKNEGAALEALARISRKTDLNRYGWALEVIASFAKQNKDLREKDLAIGILGDMALRKPAAAADIMKAAYWDMSYWFVEENTKKAKEKLISLMGNAIARNAAESAPGFVGLFPERGPAYWAVLALEAAVIENPKGVVPVIKNWLKMGTDPGTREAVGELLARAFGRGANIEASIMPLLDDEEKGVRWWAAGSWLPKAFQDGRYGPENAEKFMLKLERLLKDGEWEVRWGTTWALENASERGIDLRRYPSIMPTLVGLLGDGHWEMRWGASGALKRAAKSGIDLTRYDGTIKMLERLLEDENAGVRTNCAGAFRYSAPHLRLDKNSGIIKKLGALSKDEADSVEQSNGKRVQIEKVSDNAIYALGGIGSRNPGLKPYIRKLVKKNKPGWEDLLW